MALIYSVTAGPPVDRDVVTRQLTAEVNGEVKIAQQRFPGDTTDFGEHEFPQDAHVRLTLVDIDDAGNRSQAAQVEFTATDTIPPAMPGAFGVTIVRENNDPAPVEDEA